MSERGEIEALDTAWVAYAQRIEAAGRRLAEDGFPADPRLRAEGYRYVTRIAALARLIYVEHPSTVHPTLFRYGDDTTPFGATNTDNSYYRAMVDPEGTYRITADVTDVKEVLVSVQDGEFVLGKVDVLAEVGLDDLTVVDGRIEVTLGGPRQPTDWLPLAPEAVYVNVREFVGDWESDGLATFHIERLDRSEPAPPLTPAALVDGLDRAATWVEASIQTWHDFAVGAAAVLPVNGLGPPTRPAGGAAAMLHSACRWDLDPGQALLVEIDPVEASYWSIQAYVLDWMQPLDFVERTTSLNDGQMAIDDDGRTRIVMAHEDPGVPNWLDTTGLRSGLLNLRYVRPTVAPTPTSTVIDLAEVRDHLPASTPTVTADQRAEQIRARRRGITRRFRR